MIGSLDRSRFKEVVPTQAQVGVLCGFHLNFFLCKTLFEHAMYVVKHP